MLNFDCTQHHLSHADIDQIEDFRGANVFGDVSPCVVQELATLLMLGIIFSSCSDGKRFRDALGFLNDVLMQHADEVHPLTLDGGPQAGPLSEFEFMRKRVGIGHMKGYKTLVMLGHAPCLACHLEQKSIFEAVRRLFEMKDFLKQHFPDLKIILFFQVDYRGNKETCKRAKNLPLVSKSVVEIH